MWRNVVDIIRRLFITIGIWAVALIPVWLYVGARSLLAPHGFFEELFVFGVGVWLLGVFQLALLVIGIFATFALWTDD